MKFASLVYLITFLTYISSSENEQIIESESEKGYRLAINAVTSILFGRGDPNSPETFYKDPFIDTSQSAMSLLENANDQVTLDDIIRLFIQTVLLMIGKNRTDLFPDDFNEKNPVYGDAIKQLSEILEKLLNEGSGKVTLKEIKPLIKNLRNEELWASLSRLNSHVAEQIKLEELKEEKNNNTNEEL